MAIKTREFWTNQYNENIDELINNFLEEEQNIEIIDIKYQAVVYQEISRPIVTQTLALVIYKEVKE